MAANWLSSDAYNRAHRRENSLSSKKIGHNDFEAWAFEDFGSKPNSMRSMTPQHGPPPDDQRRQVKLRTWMFFVALLSVAFALRSVFSGDSLFEVTIFVLPYAFCWMAAFGLLVYDLLQSSTGIWNGIIVGGILCWLTLLLVPGFIYPETGFPEFW